MSENDQVRRELSHGMGEPQDIKDMAFTVTRKEPDFDPSSILYFDSFEAFELWLAKRAS